MSTVGTGRRIAFALKLFALLLLAAYIAGLSLANQDSAVFELFLFGYAIEAPLFIMVLASMLTGFLIGVLLHYPRRFKQAIRMRQMNEKIEAQEIELKVLRAERRFHERSRQAQIDIPVADTPERSSLH